MKKEALDEAQKMFYEKVRQDYIDMIKRQVYFEEKARQYKFILQLAEKFKQGDAASIAEFIDMEKKQAEKDKNSLKTNINTLTSANETIISRKKYIPMLELEACILTTCKLPESLFTPNIQLEKLKNDDIKSKIEDLNSIKFTNKEGNKNGIIKLFDLPFQTNMISADQIKKGLQIITHAQVTVALLSLMPNNWPSFLSEFKNIYLLNPDNRYSLLYFLTTWFEMRPKHFLKMIPYLIDLIEESNDGDLLIKHLRIILDSAKRNMLFRFLPLDSVPPHFHLKYIQTSEYHKLISGTDATTMQNSFKSNMLKRFDFASTRLEIKNTNSNSNNQNANNKSNTESNSTNTNANNKTNEENNYPQQPNTQDFVDAIAILLTTVQNSLSFDFFINNEDPNLADIENTQEYKTMSEINLDNTHNLKNLFTHTEFNYWKEKIKTIEIAQKGAEKLRSILDGFSNWVIDTLKSQREEHNDAAFESIANNVQILNEGVSLINKEISQKYLTINLQLLENHPIKQYINEKAMKIFNKYKKLNNESVKVPECFFTVDQSTFKSEKGNIIELNDKEKEHEYNEILNIAYNILILLSMKPELKEIHMKEFDYKSILKKEFDNHNERTQQYVDPWSIRIIFYHFTKYIFDKPNVFSFEV